MKAIVRGALLTLLVASTAAAQEQAGPSKSHRGSLAGSAGIPAESAARTARHPVVPPGPPDLMGALLRATDAPPIDLSGAWTGVYCVNDVVMLVDVTLSPAGATAAVPEKRQYTGALHVASVVFAPVRGPARPQVQGDWNVLVNVDPGSGVLMIDPRPPSPGAPRASGNALRPITFRGVYDAPDKEIAGQLWQFGGTIPTQPYFLFARSDNAAIKALAQHAASIPPGLTAGPGDAPTQDAIAKWAAKYEAEYPNSAQQDSMNKVVIQSLPLFRDTEFKPVFGATYDAIDYDQLALSMQLVGAPVRRAPVARGAAATPPATPAGLQSRDPAERAQAIQQLQAEAQAQAQPTRDPRTAGRTRTPAPARTPADQNFARQYMYLQYVLRPSADRLIAAAAMRSVDAWQSDELARFGKDAPVASTFDDLAALEAALPERESFAWPSEKKAWPASLEQLRVALAPRTLAANVQERTGQAQGLDGAYMLVSWSTDNATLLKDNPESARTAAQKQIDDKLDSILDQLLTGPRVQITKLGTGASAIRNGVIWYPGFSRDFAFAQSRPPVQKFLRDFLAQREKDLAAAGPDFLRAIADSKSIDALNALVLSNFTIPGDQQMKSYVPIAQALAKREMELDQEHMMSLFSDDEKKLMDRPGHIDVEKGKGLAPSADDVRLAILREYAEQNGVMIDAHTTKIVTRLAAPMMGIPFSAVIKINEVKIVSFKPGDQPGEFDCLYETDQEVSIPQDNVVGTIDPRVRQGLDDSATMINAALKATPNDQQVVTVKLYDDGWGVPGAKEGGVVLRALDQMFKMNP